MAAMGDDEAAAAQAQNAAARRLFAGPCAFVAGAASADRLPPPDLPEIAFAGRSNVGKSSLLNALTGRNALARASNTPGRTRQINFFRLRDKLMLVDLPGYGYARAAKTEIAAWSGLTLDYLRGRPNLRRVCLLIDARRGLTARDAPTLETLDRAAVAYCVALTKADKAPRGDLNAIRNAVAAALKTHPAALPRPIATSARTRIGLDELRVDLAHAAA